MQHTIAIKGIAPPRQEPGFLSQALAKFAEWRKQRATRAALERLDARMLRDVGIDYSDRLVLTHLGGGAVQATRHRVIHFPGT